VFGPGDHALNKLVGFTNLLPFLPLFGNGKQLMQPVYVDDVGRAAADLATKPDVTGQVYEIGGPQRMSMNEVLQTALSVKGRKRFILHNPVFVGKAMGTVFGMTPFAPLTADAVEFILQPAVADMTALDAKVPTKHTPLREGLETYMK
jgi:NADH dehydrogenase